MNKTCIYISKTLGHKSPGTPEFVKYLRKCHKNHILLCDSSLSIKFNKCKSKFHTGLHNYLLLRKSNSNLNHPL